MSNKNNPIKNTYTFSGQDIRVIVYKSPETIRKLQKDGDYLRKEYDQASKEYGLLTAQQKKAKSLEDSYNDLAAKSEAQMRKAQAELENAREIASRAYEEAENIESSIDPTDPASTGYANIQRINKLYGQGDAAASQAVTASFDVTSHRNDSLRYKDKAKGYEKTGKAIVDRKDDIAAGITAYNADFDISDPADTFKKFNKRIEEQKAYAEIGSLDGFSFSTFREKVAVRTLGRSHALGYTKGARTIAGSMTFNSMQENELLAFMGDIGDESFDGNLRNLNKVMLDQLDPFNVILLFSNEMGGNSVLQLFNVELASENQRMSVHDLVIQNNINFYATDIIPMQDTGNLFRSTRHMVQGLVDRSFQAAYDANKNSIKKTIEGKAFGAQASELLSRSRGLF